MPSLHWQELQLFCFSLYEAELLVMFHLQEIFVYSVACLCEPSASIRTLSVLLCLIESGSESQNM